MVKTYRLAKCEKGIWHPFSFTVKNEQGPTAHIWYADRHSACVESALYRPLTSRVVSEKVKHAAGIWTFTTFTVCVLLGS